MLNILYIAGVNNFLHCFFFNLSQTVTSGFSNLYIVRATTPTVVSLRVRTFDRDCTKNTYQIMHFNSVGKLKK